MKKKTFPLFFLGLLWFSPLLAEYSIEEKRHARRILEFWKDKEFTLVKSQINAFLSSYPTSASKDYFYALLGDIYCSEEKYNDAISAYNKISSEGLSQTVFTALVMCHYHLKNYSTIIQQVEPLALSSKERSLSKEEQRSLLYYGEALLQLAQTEKKLKNTASFDAAQAAFERLIDSNESVSAHLGLAAIHIAKGEVKNAVAYLLAQATSDSIHQEILLYEAGKLQIKNDPQHALLILSSLQQMQGKKQEEAALLKTALLFELKEFQQLINEKETLRIAIKEKNSPTLSLFIGRSQFSLHQYNDALNTLEPLLSSSFLTKKDHPLLLLTLAATHYHLGNHQEVDTFFHAFKSSFANDPLFPHLLYIKSLNEKEKGNIATAQECLEKIIDNYPDFILAEEVHFAYNRFLFSQRQWEKSHDGFATLIKKYPNHSSKKEALSLLLAAGDQLLKESVAEEREKYKQLFINDLRILIETNAFPISDLIRYKLRLASLLHESQHYEEAASLLASFVGEETIDPKYRAQAHILLGKRESETQNFSGSISNFEAALTLDPSLPQQLSVHLNLFNGYVQLKNEEQAAKYLNQVYQSAPSFVSKDNKNWLASYYFNALNALYDETLPIFLENPKEIVRAETALSLMEELTDNGSSPDSIAAEERLYQRASLYGWLGKFPKQLALLEILHSAQKNRSTIKWALSPRTQLALANAKAKGQQIEEALALYTALIATPRLDPFIAASARLQFSRLTFSLFSDEKRSLSNPQMVTILSLLKDLFLQKQLQQEPIHLEAAIEYARIRTLLEPPAERLLQQLSLYHRIKEEYTSKDDILSKDYHENRLLMPEKNHLYETYLTWIDAHIATLEARKAEEKGNNSERDWKIEAARTLYSSLLNKKETLTPYLKERTENALSSTQ